MLIIAKYEVYEKINKIIGIYRAFFTKLQNHPQYIVKSIDSNTIIC